MTVNYKPKTEMITITGNLARHSEIEVYNKERGDMVIRANTLSTKTRVTFCFKVSQDFLHYELIPWRDERRDKIREYKLLGLNSFIKISKASKIYLDINNKTKEQSLTVILSSRDDLQFFASSKNTNQKLILKKQQDHRIIILR